MSRATVEPIGNSVVLKTTANILSIDVYDVFTTRTFLSQSQIYEEDGEVTHDNT